MTYRQVTTANAAVSLVFGALGLLVPDALALAFGVRVDATAVALARLACAGYVGFGALAWTGRAVVDPDAQFAIAVGLLVAWILGAIVVVGAIVSGLVGPAAWAIVGLQVAFVIAWLPALLRPRSLASFGSEAP
jgi:hypothetical protein